MDAPAAAAADRLGRGSDCRDDRACPEVCVSNSRDNDDVVAGSRRFRGVCWPFFKREKDIQDK